MPARLLNCLAALLLITGSPAVAAGAHPAAGIGAPTPERRAVIVSALPSAAQVSAGGAHTCAVTVGGGAKCWGGNWSAQLGDGTTADHSTPVDVSGLESGVQAVGAGTGHTCALTSAGGVKCWGDNYSGQLGNGTNTSSSTPVDVIALPGEVHGLSVGSVHACVLTSQGGVMCWGDNTYGQLGDGTTTGRRTPASVTGLESGVQAVAAGAVHTCALTNAGGVKCWGDNYSGKLGDGTNTSRTTPVDVIGLTAGVRAVTASMFGHHTCALTGSGGVKCWGDNWDGQLGDGTTASSNVPVDVSGLASGMEAVSAGCSHTCGLTSAAGVKCWGWNGVGQLGDGTMTSSRVPVDVHGLSKATQVSAGANHNCVLTSGGGVKCWGLNSNGQLGDGTTTDAGTPVEVVGFADTPVPLPVDPALDIALDPSGVRLTWPHIDVDTAGAPVEIVFYEVWVAASPYFDPDTDPTAERHQVTPPDGAEGGDLIEFLDLGAVPGPETSYYYLVRAFSSTGQVSAGSTPVAALGYALVP